MDVMLLDLDDTFHDRQASFDAWASEFLLSLGRYSLDEATWVRSKEGDELTSRPALFEAIRQG